MNEPITVHTPAKSYVPDNTDDQVDAIVKSYNLDPLTFALPIKAL